MHEPHPLFTTPSDPNIKVWRYMDFTKLVSLLDSRRLFFTRSDKFEDQFEGSWPKLTIESRMGPPEEGDELFADARNEMFAVVKHWRRFTAVNCWHMNEHESAAMWKLYLKSNEGIAIQSTFDLLCQSISNDGTKVFIGQVNYIDYEKESFPDVNNTLLPFVYKRKSFEHEREVRAVISKFPDSDIGARLATREDTMAGGIPIRVDLERLVEKIYVAPSSPGWFVDLVKSLVAKYSYNFEVVHSDLGKVCVNRAVMC